MVNTIDEILDGYKSGVIKPSEYIYNILEKVEKNPYNAFIYFNKEYSIKKARELDRLTSMIDKFPLFGIPIAVKDNFLIEGWQTTAGSKFLKNYIAPYTSTVVKRLEKAGAIIVGKTNMDEFAFGSSNENSAFGPVSNPYDTTSVPGGSSGGSAVVVSAKIVPVSIGTDTGGSIRQPASFCGVFGIKPTYGRVSRYGIIAFASSLDQAGVFSVKVKDSARVLEVISGHCKNDSTTSILNVPNYCNMLHLKNKENIRIGIDRNWFSGADSCVEKNVNEAISFFQSSGMIIKDISLPHIKYSLSSYYIIATSEASSNLGRYTGIHYGGFSSKELSPSELIMKNRKENFGKEVKLRIMLGTFALSRGYYEAFYLKACKVRKLIQKDFLEAFKNCDAIMIPSSPTTAFKIGEKINDPLKMYLSDIYTIPASLCGLPALSIPCGFDSKGLPVGLQIIGKPFDEPLILALSNFYENERSVDE